MGSLVNELDRYRLVGLDTPIFVYHVEQTPRRATPAGHVLRSLADGKFAGITSVLTLWNSPSSLSESVVPRSRTHTNSWFKTSTTSRSLASTRA